MRIAVICFIVIMAFAVAKSEPTEQHDWHVITKAENGHVSFIHNLTLSEAERIYDALEDRRGSGFYAVQPSDIRDRKILGPEQWDGCKKAMRHHFEYTRYVISDWYCSIFSTTECVKWEGNPHARETYEYLKCSLCGASSAGSGDYCETP